MKAKVKTNGQVIEVRLLPEPNVKYCTYEDIATGERYLDTDLNFEDLTDYKTWVESLIHDLAVKAYEQGWEKRKDIAADIVLYAFEVMGRMMQENKTFRL